MNIQPPIIALATVLGLVARKVDNFNQRIVIFPLQEKGIKINYTKDIELASVKKCLQLENDFLSGL